MKRAVVFIALILGIWQLSSAQWTPQPSPTSNTLYAVQFVNQQTGWVAGSEVFLKTTDGGTNWIKQDMPKLYLSGMHMFDSNVGWVVGYTGFGLTPGRGLRIKTTDGGNTWPVVDSSQSGYFEAVYFVDSQNGWIVGGQGPYPDTTGLILKTSNGGSSWQRVDGGKVRPLLDVYFVSSSKGWAVGDFGDIYVTTDGGLNWQLAAKATRGSFDAPLRQVRFATPDSGWVVGGLSGNRVIGRTTDSGVSWQFDFSFTGMTLHGVSFLDSKTGWAVGGLNIAPKILRTTDGGVTWEVQAHGLGDQNTTVMEGVWMVDRNHGWIVGRSGTILKTTNGGLTNVERDGGQIPLQVSLLQNYPNPFNPRTVIPFDLPAGGHVSVKVFDLLGREVRSLDAGYREAGRHEIVFESQGIASGVYYYTISVNGRLLTKKMVVLQ